MPRPPPAGRRCCSQAHTDIEHPQAAAGRKALQLGRGHELADRLGMGPQAAVERLPEALAPEGGTAIGGGAALQRVRRHDDAGNASFGRVVAKAAARNVVHAEGSAVVLYGVSDLVVVVRDGVTLVTTVDRAHDLKALVDDLPPDLKELR